MGAPIVGRHLTSKTRRFADLPFPAQSGGPFRLAVLTGHARRNIRSVKLA